MHHVHEWSQLKRSKVHTCKPSYTVGQKAPTCRIAPAQQEQGMYLQALLYLRRDAGSIHHHVGHAGITWGEPQHIPRAFGIQDAHNLCSARRLTEDGHNLCCGPYAWKLCHAALTRAPSCVGLSHPSICSRRLFVSHRATQISCL